ncbi:NAD(P)-dependent oxidoreductase [Nocardia farcinica]|uniref:NAD(P)-dependent oxidoreductase n=1 Tax=Nocardia farcinica TaxID=37329 RepID=UPI003F684CBC
MVGSATHRCGASVRKLNPGRPPDNPEIHGGTMSKTPVTVLGLGRMGAAVAEILVRAGHPTTVWNRTPGRAAHLDALGARRAPDPRTAVAAGRLIITVLADTPAATELLTPLTDALAGRTVLNVATGRPDQAAELTTRLGGIPVLDAGIFGVPQTLGTPDTLLVYSGSPAANTEFGAVVALLGEARYVGSDPGSAARHDMAVLAGMYGLFGGFFQAVAMTRGERAGAVGFTETYLAPWLRALLDMLPTLAAEIDSGEYPVNYSDLAVNRSGLADIRATARAEGVTTDLLDPLQRIFDAEVAAGHGAASFTRAVAALTAAPVTS